MTTILVFFFFDGAGASEAPAETAFPMTMLMSRSVRRYRRRV